MSKPKLGYLLFDLPSDHEIESTLATECRTVEAIIHNNGMPARVKRICVASPERFMNFQKYKYAVQFVHLACHGGKKSIGMLGGHVEWKEVAKQVARHLHPLANDQQRIICFSCCYSKDGFDHTKSAFSSYFTGAYLFAKTEVPFAQAVTVWAMFYLKKKLTKPHEAIVQSINDFIGEKLLIFKKY
ncbi:MAG: hypothetical protein EOM62_11610 [Bacteroidia bacterium]|nr:hypothetical protein [Bacteroidia bacterium]